MLVGPNHHSLVLLKSAVFIPEQVAFGILTILDSSGIPFLVVPTLESLLAFFGAWPVCNDYVFNQVESFL